MTHTTLSLLCFKNIHILLHKKRTGARYTKIFTLIGLELEFLGKNSFSFLFSKENIYLFLGLKIINLKKKDNKAIFSHQWSSQIIGPVGYRGMKYRKRCKLGPLDRQPGNLGKWRQGLQIKKISRTLFNPQVCLFCRHTMTVLNYQWRELEVAASPLCRGEWG